MHKSIYSSLLILLVIIIYSSCTTSKKLAYIENNEVSSKADDTVFSYQSNAVNYKINKNDILLIRFASTNEEVTKYFEIFSGFNQESNNNGSQNLMGIHVNDSGYIEIPIIGKFYALGYTIEELQNALQLEADKYLINSRLIVKLLNFKITFLGEVGRQGVLQVNENQINLLEAIAQVGGISDYGDRENILIIRKTEKGYLTYRVDITDRALIEQKEYYLMPNDLIIVETRKYKIISENLREYSTLLATLTSIITAITLIFSLTNGK